MVLLRITVERFVPQLAALWDWDFEEAAPANHRPTARERLIRQRVALNNRLQWHLHDSSSPPTGRRDRFRLSERGDASVNARFNAPKHSDHLRTGDTLLSRVRKRAPASQGADARLGRHASASARVPETPASTRTRTERPRM
jgi:hypothetical protein